MSLFDPLIELELTPDEAAVFERHIEGAGGQQGLLRKLHAGYDPTTRRMAAEQVDLDTCRRYAYDHGGGGHQDRFKAVLKAAWRAGYLR